MTLDELRNEIDEIDRQLIELFAKRMQAIESVAVIKKENGLTIYNSSRERAIIERVQSSVEPKFSFYASSFCSHLLELSKALQREIISQGHTNEYFTAIINTIRKEVINPRVCVQGAIGSYSMEAAQMMYPDCQITHLSKWKDVLNDVEAGICDYGVLPVENSSAGSVNEVYDLLIKHRHFIVKALPLSVDHYLLGIRGANLNDITNVYSHAHAFPQCSEFFAKHYKLQKIAFANTAMAAEFVAKAGRKDYAAIAAKECAHIYGLDIIAKSIQMNSDNTTRFVSVSKIPEIDDNANKISIVFTLPHLTGSLYRTLSRFALAGLNLNKIESRPNAEKNFEYYFYVDFTGSIKSKNILTLLSALKDELPVFAFLGNYSEKQ